MSIHAKTKKINLMNDQTQSPVDVSPSQTSKLPLPENGESKALTFREFLALAQERSDRWDEIYQAQNNQDNKSIGHLLRLLGHTFLQKTLYRAYQVWQGWQEKR